MAGLALQLAEFSALAAGKSGMPSAHCRAGIAVLPAKKLFRTIVRIRKQYAMSRTALLS
jgi:hypothetical protein